VRGGGSGRRSLDGVGRATATALGHHRVLHHDPPAHIDGGDCFRRHGDRQVVVLVELSRRAIVRGSAIPPQQGHVLVVGGPTVHAGRYRARLLTLGTIALQQPPRPEPLTQVLPLSPQWARGPAPQVLLDLPAQLAGYLRPLPSTVGQREVLGVKFADLLRYLTGGHQPAMTVPPANVTTKFYLTTTTTKKSFRPSTIPTLLERSLVDVDHCRGIARPLSNARVRTIDST